MIEEGRVQTDLAPSPRVGRRQPSFVIGNMHKKIAVGGIVMLSLFIFTAVVIVDSLHTIEEGSVGLYFVQGALDDRISRPGIHWAIPFVTEIEMVTIRPKTDTLPSIRYKYGQ